MKYLSVCSGIEAATVAWHHMGWQPVAFSEIERFPSQVLAYHYPDVPNVGDMTKFKEWNLGSVDLLVGGTPCQSFSVAGLRKGLDDPRGNLMLTYLAIAKQYRPKWLVWENVPGVLSSNGGNDFATFLRGMGQCGYGFAYRVLDAQYFGVAQRRRRVFVVGCLGDWRRSAAVLFERESLSGNPAPSREKREEVSKTLTRGISQRFDAETETKIPVALAENTIGRQPENGGNGDGFTIGGPMYTLNATGVHGVAQPISFHVDAMPDQMNFNTETSASLTCSQHAGIATQMAVRRLTPVECERLQGFPDNYTNIPWRKQSESPDSPRYKSLGNSMAVPVMKWIGERIQKVNL
jgi:DNA (cytosine-5)-methyltransferase 1